MSVVQYHAVLEGVPMLWILLVPTMKLKLGSGICPSSATAVR